jgi:hypothetical protein
VLLSVRADVILERVAGRESNAFGKRDVEREPIVDDLANVEPLLRPCATAEDAHAPNQRGAYWQHGPRRPIYVQRRELDDARSEDDCGCVSCHPRRRAYNIEPGLLSMALDDKPEPVIGEALLHGIPEVKIKALPARS